VEKCKTLPVLFHAKRYQKVNIKITNKALCKSYPQFPRGFPQESGPFHPAKLGFPEFPQSCPQKFCTITPGKIVYIKLLKLSCQVKSWKK
jgi:hypothetical protein